MTKKLPDPVRETLRFDPLAEAERLTGKSYKQNDPTSWLGFALAIDHNAKKHQMLEAMGDTTFSTPLGRYIEIAKAEGFREVLCIPFHGECAGRFREERWFCFYHDKDGILLAFDTFENDHVNGGTFYYNWQPKCNENGKPLPGYWGHTSSGGCFWRDEHKCYGWSGHHDCREALRWHIRDLRENGQFIVPWEERPFLWLLDYGVTHEGNQLQPDHKAETAFYDQKRRERFMALPEDVRTKLGPEHKQ